MPGSVQPNRSADRRGKPPRSASTSSSFPRFLGLAVLGVLLPGLGLIAAGRRRIGFAVLAVFVLGVAALIVYARREGFDGMVRLGTDTGRINVFAFGILAVAAIWLLIAVVSFYLLDSRRLGTGQRLLAATLVIVVASVVVAPMGVGARYAFTQRNFIESVFPDDRHQFSLTIPAEATDEDPWAGRDRVNLLILGSDGAPDRDGVRTDTIMVASVNAQTGDTALFSLPRNLQHVPFPEGPVRDAYPDGFRGEPPGEFWLNAVYRNIPAQFPEAFEGLEDPGAEALKLAVGEALGLEIHYYVMVNLDGFKAIVDALGGVVVDVPYRIPMGNQATNWGTCTAARDWIEEGEQRRLSGAKALWFARARCGPPPIDDDYERMRRQRCLIGAIAEQADPFTLITRYLRLEGAIRENISTDISQRRLEDFAELALRIQDAEIRTLPFTDEVIEYHRPDYALIQDFVRESLEPESEPEPGFTEPPPSGENISDDQTDGAPDESAENEQPDDEETGDTTDEITDETQPDESEGAQSIDEVC
ncbi:LCP family protein [Phytoactinopolyspora alkaliphila]|uniref:LCP family protein n=1 Tax=Phytoactinopolyspora alkaliphila TaxID=1783498 RepID=A0A6N9YL15_9ACTN|nr:LCP family protein [Phytoactinopolyspora alkaliphila]NED95645.1 LCP family protein [Phytoactinopolyspora alkaliphila]